MTPEQLAEAIRAALQVAVDDGDLTISAIPEVRVERPRSREHGDWSTNIALQLAKQAGMSARSVAEMLASRLLQVNGVGSVDVAGPGFVNITLEAASAGSLAQSIVEAGPEYGRNDSLAGEVINLEFVSANPNGPLHLGHTRWAALGGHSAPTSASVWGAGRRRALRQRRGCSNGQVRSIDPGSGARASHSRGWLCRGAHRVAGWRHHERAPRLDQPAAR